MSKALCIIPARGGSKRIPNKNIKEFHGKPIIAYSIEAALKSEIFDQVMVSTDSIDIKEISVKYGAKVPFIRSKENADDFATTVDVVNEVLEKYQKEGLDFTRVCVLYPCAPFVQPIDLVKGYKALDEFDSVIPVVSFSFPPLRSFIIKDSYLSFKWPEFEKTRSQDLDELFHDAGQWYFFNHYGKNHDSLVKNYTTPFILDSARVQDIDTPADWELAELKFTFLNENI